ncbi:uncharacterized protein EI90DRAFT_2202693 [Cantharellus anzutake]|uniref:uncharacterized protein n=1 Tax=Cantharellus anzutake TaxID=1750568 RepID=UPI0019068ADC|nr:uncharacterized protein EI90DRAFT_2202693 [Cantharellus anzutake]KAF8324962.1 hypothetical protein EI90DRAFT_2202693 [Cantharellus anzutake]
MSRKNPLLFFSWRSKAKSPAPELSLHDPQPLHTSRSLFQASRIDITNPQVTRDGEAGSHAVSPSSMPTPPSSLRDRFVRWVLRRRSPNPNRDKSTTQRAKLSTSPQSSPYNSRLSHSHLPSEETAPSRTDPQAMYETGAVSAEQPGSTGDGPLLCIESLSSAAATGSHGDRKKPIMEAIKLLLQTSATALKLAPIPNLYQIPNTLLAWINTYESIIGNAEDMKMLYVVIQKVHDSVFQPLREWTGEIPPELGNLTWDFHAALKKRVEEVESIQRKNLLTRAIRAPDITQQISNMKSCLNDAISRFQLRISTLILLRTERVSVQSSRCRIHVC